jgi:hypothetical protein
MPSRDMAGGGSGAGLRGDCVKLLYSSYITDIADILHIHKVCVSAIIYKLSVVDVNHVLLIICACR